MTALTPYPHQADGIQFLLNGGSLLAYDMGLGKTLTSIWAAEQIRLGETVLICAPVSVIGVWETEILRVNPHASVKWMTSKNCQDLAFDDIDYILVTHDLASRTKAVGDRLRGLTLEVLIIDEAHLLANRTAQRTQAWLLGPKAIADYVPTVWLLSGTPTPSHAGQLYPLVKATDFTRLKGMTADKFEETYCRHKMIKVGPNRQRKVIAGSNAQRMPMLRKSLDGWWKRARKADVIDLPPKLVRVTPIYAQALDASAISALKGEEADEIRYAINTGKFDQGGDEKSLSRFRSLLSATKGRVAGDYVLDRLNNGLDCAVLWFWHRAGMDLAQEVLEKAGKTVARIDGSTPPKQRKDIVKRFQEGGADVFLAQIKAAGTGITLTRSSYAAFAELSWTPAENLQAEDRIHRIGQNDTAQIEILAVRDSLDYAVMTTVERKTKELRQLETNL